MWLSPILALAAIPRPPCKTDARSVAMSPNMFGSTTTSKSSGSLTSHIVNASMNAWFVLVLGYSPEISSKICLKSLHPRSTLLLSTQVTFWGVPDLFSLRAASSNPNLITLSEPFREIGLGSHATSPSSPGNFSIVIGSSLDPTAACAERLSRL